MGRLTIPYEYRGRLIILPTVIVADLEQDLLLGYDFWIAAVLKIVDEREGRVLALSSDSTMNIKTEVELQDRDRQALEEAVENFPSQRRDS